MMMEEVEVELMKTIADDVQEDLDVCRECTGTWKVACYGAWYPKSQFWEDFLEGEWEEGAYAPRAVCLRLMCGMLFCFFAPIWCCKAVLFFLFWPCVCCVRTLWEGNCNRDYCRTRRSRKPTSQPLTYIESAQPTRPAEISYQFSAPRGVPPESPIPEIRIETELENGTYVTSPVEDSEVDRRQLSTKDGRLMRAATTNTHQVPTATTTNGRQMIPATTTTNGRQLPTATPNSHQSHVTNGRTHAARNQYPEDDLPPPYPMLSESPRGAKHSHSRSPTSHTSHSHSTPPPPPPPLLPHSRSPSPHRRSPSPHSEPATHSTAKKTMSAKAKGMENNLYRAVVMEGFQGITGKVTTV